jgi:glycosyltransferase involved in cell wall biosynthesis
MKVLIINYHFPPSNTSHSYRWALLRDYFLSQGHEVDFICGGVPCKLDAGRNIKRVNFPKTVRHFSRETIVKNENKSSFFRLKVRLLLFFKKVYRKIFWPDGLWHWLPYSIYEVIKRRNKKYDLVVGYSPTFSAVITAFLYKKLNKHVRLIVDFGDPFSVSKEMPANNYALYKTFNRFAEKKIFDSADLISLTNEKTFDLYHSIYPSVSKFCIVPHLVNVEDFYVEKMPPKTITTVGYVGAFHKKIREPYLAIDKLNQLSVEACCIEFYGPLNGLCFDESELIKHYGVVDRKSAIELSKQFDIVINVENEDCVMTPSKVFDCMATGKPILNFLSSTGSSSFSEYSLVLDVDSNTKIAEIELFISNNKGKVLSRSEVESVLKEKTLQSIGDKYLSVAEYE